MTVASSLEVGDCAGLARELRRLREQQAVLAQLGSNARRLAESRYSSERAVQAWLALLASIAPAAEPAAERAVSADLRSAQSGT